MLNQIKWIFSCMERKDKQLFNQWLFISIFLTVLDFVNVFLLLKLTDRIRNNVVGNQTIILTICMGLVVLAGGILSYVTSRTSTVLKNRIRNSFSSKMFKLFCNEDLLLHNGRLFSQVLTYVRFDCETCSNIFITLVYNFTQIIVWVVYAAVLVYKVGWIGVGIAAMLISVAMLIIVRNKRKMYMCGNQIRESRVRLNTLVGTMHGAYKELKIDMSREKLEDRYRDFSNANAEMEIAYTNAVQVISQALKTVITSGIYFGLAILLLIDIQTQNLFATVILLISAMAKLVPLTAGFISSINQYNSSQAAIKQLYSNTERYLELTEKQKRMETLRKKAISFRQGITVENLSFKYPNGKVILEDVSFFFPRGKKIAITGASGIGKTTLLDLLLGLLKPDSGSIRYDDYDIVQGKDQEGECYANLGDIISYVTQTVYLNGGTVRENVVFLSDYTNDDKVMECLAYADMLQEINDMPDGLNTVLGENGTTISGGQRQRLALARALYKDFEILIMDEATAALDDETEKAVIDTISALQGEKTLLMVTHHKSLVEQCDIVYQIRDHKVVRIR